MKKVLMNGTTHNVMRRLARTHPLYSCVIILLFIKFVFAVYDRQPFSSSPPFSSKRHAPGHTLTKFTDLQTRNNSGQS